MVFPSKLPNDFHKKMSLPAFAATSVINDDAFDLKVFNEVSAIILKCFCKSGKRLITSMKSHFLRTYNSIAVTARASATRGEFKRIAISPK